MVMMLLDSKFNKWSAPGVMSVFLIICLLVIFSFETLGLTNKEKNVELRVTNLEISIIYSYIFS